MPRRRSGTPHEPAAVRRHALAQDQPAEHDPGFLNSIVLCELVWVLKAAYGATREETTAVLEQILRTRQFEVADRDTVRAALEAFKQGQADFADCLIGQLNQQAGCDETATFDKQAGALDTFRLL